MKIYYDVFSKIVSLESLFLAWQEFRKGKSAKEDVQQFEFNLEENIFQLHDELANGLYRHGPYEGFFVHDPKRRHIHKALVRDRVVHHAIFSVINPIFEETFIPTSFSCRVGFGAHRGVARLHQMLRSVSCNGTRSCFALKCDIKKFFDSIDHNVLLDLIGNRMKDPSAGILVSEVINSYATRERERAETATEKPVCPSVT